MQFMLKLSTRTGIGFVDYDEVCQKKVDCRRFIGNMSQLPEKILIFD